MSCEVVYGFLPCPLCFVSVCVFLMCYVTVRFLFGGGRQNCGCGSTWTIAGAVLLLLLCWTARLFLSVYLPLLLLLLLLVVSVRPDVLLPLRALLRVLPPSLLCHSVSKHCCTFFNPTHGYCRLHFYVLYAPLKIKHTTDCVIKHSTPHAS